ncbi:glycosyltransferase family 2 protein [Karstenula rhodostoma CBS 690.94]|uniref:Glycosyltransferase family 2 protein n=1 Tax=Karstenula rhodostoma CBS 690.94 TaxID=1392251 RepID=A0A9P4PTH3_9PLEO|nr:glycosyltransferase family 2 protein [Karstenula rhodostoma CBS 690.94]
MPHPRPPRINLQGDYLTEKTSASNAQPGLEDTFNSLDVVIPAHLLQATQAASKRDEDAPAWQPQRQLTVRENPLFRQLSASVRRPRGREGRVKRSSTLPSARSSREPSRVGGRSNSTRDGLAVSSSDEDTPRHVRRPDPVNKRQSWRLSYTPGNFDEIALSPRGSLAGTPTSESFPIAEHATHDFATRPARHVSNPFGDSRVDLSADTSRRSSFGDNANPFLSRNNSPTSVEQHTVPESVHVPKDVRKRSGTLETVVNALVPDALQRKLTNNATTGGIARHSSMRKTFEQAKVRGLEMQRNKYAMWAFEYGIYVFLLCFIYFVLIGIPLWNGAVWWLYWVVANKFVIAGGYSITLGIALFYAFAPLLIVFEDDPPPIEITAETKIQEQVKDTALLIPCYKSAGLIAATLEAALKVFPASHIYVLANGNSPTPLDNTEEVCLPYGVNHIWSPVGSKIVAQFVGCYAAKAFKNVLLIDDDCALPPDFPVVTERLKGNVLCLGYTIKSVGPNSSKGNYCQQAQDLEYKLSGIQRDFAGRIGSATFPHGAIALWDRELLVKTFHEHPGFSVSEDWFFGHVARKLGSRIKMCSQVFVETETPTAVFFSSGGSRGGFGEMTIFSQRFKRWNFFFVNGMWFNMAYIFGSWKLGWWEIGAKIFVFQEVYETLLYLMTPFILPISFYVRPSFCGILLGATAVMYFINTIIFNEFHLRRKGERIGWFTVYVYYLPYKMVLTLVNVASCYWSLYKYARYFARRHPRVIEDEKAVEVVVRLEESAYAAEAGGLGRSLTVRKVAEVSASRSSVETATTAVNTTRSNPPRVELTDSEPTHYEPYYHRDELDMAGSGASTPARGLMQHGAFDFSNDSAGPTPNNRSYATSMASEYDGWNSRLADGDNVIALKLPVFHNDATGNRHNRAAINVRLQE